MGGDVCHHNGELRPSEHLPLPVTRHQQSLPHLRDNPSPGTDFAAIQKQRARGQCQSLFDPSVGLDIPQAIQTLRNLQELDADPNVLFICAHDYTVKEVFAFFPAEANEWKAKGWREKSYWKFLEDLQTRV